MEIGSGGPTGQGPMGPQEEPVIPAGVKGLLALLLVAGAVAAFFLIDPDLSLDETEDGGRDDPARAERQSDPEPGGAETEPTPEASGEPTTSAGLGSALDELRVVVGEDADLTRVQLSEGFGQFHVRQGRDEVEGYAFGPGLPESGLNATDVTVIGSDPLTRIDFPLADVDPRAVDKMLTTAGRRSRGGDFELQALDLRRDPVDGRLRWEIVGGSGGRIGIVYHANPNGTGFRSVSAGI